MLFEIVIGNVDHLGFIYAMMHKEPVRGDFLLKIRFSPFRLPADRIQRRHAFREPVLQHGGMLRAERFIRRLDSPVTQ